MNTTDSSRSRSLGFLFALAATALWSVNHFIARGLRGSVPPISLAFLRWTVATLVFLPFAARGILRERAEIRKHFPYITAVGLVGVSVFNTLIYFAGRTTTALNMSLLSLTFPVLIILLSRLLFGERISFRRLTGILIVLFGVAVLLTGGRPKALIGLELAAGDLLMLLAALLFAVYTLLLKRRPSTLSLESFQFSTFAVGTLLLAPAFAWERAVLPPLVLDGLAWGAVLYVGVFASLGAFLSWNKAIERIGAAKAGLVYYTLPVWSGLVAWIFLGEAPSVVQIVSMGMIVGGIALAGKDAPSALPGRNPTRGGA